MSWATLGAHLRRERARRRQSQVDFARETGLSVRLIGALENAERSSYDPSTLDRVEIVLGWSAGSAHRVVEGGRPRHEVDADLARIRDAWPRLPLEARRMLADLAGRALRNDADGAY